MGYMGFGMRKEVYTRKPKKPFQKQNELYGDDKAKRKHNPKIKGPSKEEIFNKPRFKSLGDIKLFQLLKVTAMITLVLIAVYHAFAKPWLYQLKVKQLRTQFTESFNSDHEWLLNKVSNTGSYSHFKLDSGNNLSLVFGNGEAGWSALNNSRLKYYYLNINDTSFYGLKSFAGQLKLTTADTTIALNRRWRVSLDGAYDMAILKSKIDQSIIRAWLLDSMKYKLSITKLPTIKFEKGNSILSLYSSSEYGDFYYIKTEEEHKEGSAFMKIKENIYLKRYK